MRIISKGKDYYDHYAHSRQFSDQTYIWDRKPRVKLIDFAIPTLVYSEVRHYASHRYVKTENDFRAIGFVIWFCGTPVPVVQVYWPSSATCRTEYFYNFDSIPDIVTGDRPDGWSKHYTTKYQKFQQLFELGTKGWEKIKFEAISFCGNTPKKISVEEMHRRVGSPVFCHPWIVNKDADSDEGTVNDLEPTGRLVRAKPCVLINPNLYDLDFFQYTDAFQAFLSLERYLSNELAPRDGRMDKPISDKLKAESKGFDKFSFRKEPTKKK